MANRKLTSHAEVKDEFLRLIREGQIFDPNCLAETVIDRVDSRHAMEILAVALHDVARGVLRSHRSSIRKSNGEQARVLESFGVHVPGTGWKSVSELTAEECELIADDYEMRSDQNMHYAKEYRRLAEEIRSGGVVHLGELVQYRSELSRLTKLGLERARASGIRLGRPVRTPREVERTVMKVYAEVGTFNGTARRLNEENYLAVGGGRWHGSSVKHLINRVGDKNGDG